MTLQSLGRRLAGWVGGEYPIRASDLTPGVELAGTLVRPTDGGGYAELPAVVADCHRAEDAGVVEMHVWWTVGGGCRYPLDEVLYVLPGGAR